jgi:hypothetical protein
MRKIIITVFITVILMPLVAGASITDFPVTPDPFDFGDVNVGSPSTAQTFTLENAQTVAARIVSVNFFPGVPFSFANNNCDNQAGLWLQPGGTCTFDVIFTPTAEKHYVTSAWLNAYPRTELGLFTVEGRGVAPVVDLAPTNINFGDQTVGKSTNVYGIFLDNIGTGTLTISDITVDPPFSEDSSTTCGATLPAHDACIIGITFTPTAAGAVTGNVTITDDASDSPQTVALSGTGVIAPQPHASLSRTSIDFSYQLVNTTSTAVDVTLTNTGTAVLNIASITIDSVFDLTDDCGAVLAVNATCTLSVSFSPTAEGAATGSVEITDDSSHSPQTISLTGTGTIHDGPKASLSASSIDFGEIAFGSTGIEDYTISNIGDENMVVSDITITGTDATSFTKESNCLKTLRPGDSCTGTITFHPSTSQRFAVVETSYSATAQFDDNSADTPQLITLAGIGISDTSSGGWCSLVVFAKPNANALALSLFFLMFVGFAIIARKKLG